MSVLCRVVGRHLEVHNWMSQMSQMVLAFMELRDYSVNILKGRQGVLFRNQFYCGEAMVIFFFFFGSQSLLGLCTYKARIKCKCHKEGQPEPVLFGTRADQCPCHFFLFLWHLYLSSDNVSQIQDCAVWHEELPMACPARSLQRPPLFVSTGIDVLIPG